MASDHERAGSAQDIYLHDQLRHARSTENQALIYDLGSRPIELGDRRAKGS